MSDEGKTGEGGEIPVDPAQRAPRAKISKESLLSMADDVCPSCGADLPDRKATVCLACGYDIKANKRVRTKVTTEEYVEPQDTAFCRAGRVPWQALLGVGVGMMIGAVAMAGGDTPEGLRPFYYALKTLVYCIVHLGLGVVAIVTAAMLLRERVGQVEYGVGWMAVAIGGFFLSIQVGQLLGAGAMAQWIVGAGLGAAVYLFVIWRAFRTSRDVLLMIAGLQFIFWLLLFIYRWVDELAKATAG